MNTVLALQKMAASTDPVLDSTQSVCCNGSTNSMRNCCNAGET